MLVYSHYYLVVAIGVFSLVGWKFWERYHRPLDVRIVGVGHRIRDEDLKGYVLPQIDSVSKFYDLIAHIDSKSAPSVLYAGKIGCGKSTLMSWTIFEKTDLEECKIFGREQERAVVFSPKTFRSGDKIDFDLPNFKRIDMTNYLPSNIFENHHAFVGSLLTAVYANLTMRGIMVKNVGTQVYKLLKGGQIRTWDDFERRIREAKRGRGEFDISVLDAIEGDIQFLKDAGKQGTLNIDWSNLQENYVLDFGMFEDNRIAKIFFMEYYLRVVFKHKLNNIVAIDEVHRLLNKGETSILSEVLREGRTSIKLHLATQNISDVPSANVQFGSIFLHETQNGDDYKSMADEFVKDYVKLLKGHRFLDYTQEHQNQIIPIYELNPDRLNHARERVSAEHSQAAESNSGHADFVSDVNGNVWKTEQDRVSGEREQTSEELKEKIISELEKSEVSLYGYEIAKATGLSSQEAVKIRQPLRELVRDGKIKEIKIQVRNKEVVYYYLPDTEVPHNFMMSESEKKFVSSGWKIIFKTKHGIQGADFIIEKDGRQLIIEAETGNKRSLGEFDKKIMEYDKQVLIVVPNLEQKERYSYLPCVESGKAKVLLIPQLEDELNGQVTTA